MAFEQQGNSIEPDLPPRLREAIGRLYASPVQVPPAIDERVLSNARQSYFRRGRAWRMTRWIGAAAAAAAVVALAVRVAHSPGPTGSPRPQLARLADVNHDGRVDILDAYLVARRIADKQPLDPAWDINGDGVVDQKDVDLIANMAVSVSGGNAP